MGIIFYVSICDSLSVERICRECVREGAELPPSVVAEGMVLYVVP